MTGVLTDGLVRPHFLYVGAARAGSTWIYRMLSNHPEIFVPVAKDIQYFDDHYHLGLDWYLAHFQEGVGKICGEVSHDYFVRPGALRRIAEDLGGVKLLCCLREPGDRARSTYEFESAIGLTAGASFVQWAEAPSIRAANAYVENMRAMHALFPAENIFTYYFDDIVEDPEGLVEAVYRFLGVDPSFRSPLLRERINAAHTPRVNWLAHLAYGTAQVMRRHGLANWVGRIKHWPAFEHLLYRRGGDGAPPIPADAIAALRREAAATYPELERLVGRAVPSSWHATAGLSPPSP